jgi:DNA-directed RNA polymerase sigma subunit (sigma70/sigma32)
VIQEGIIGLASAADRFEPERNLKFSTYATYYVTNEVRRCFQQATTGPLRIPWNYYEIRAKYNTVVKDHHQKTGEAMDLDDAATQMDLTTDRLAYVLLKSEPILSLDSPLSDGYISGKNSEWADVLER